VVNTFPKVGVCDFKHLVLTSGTRFVHLMAVQTAISTGAVKIPFILQKHQRSSGRVRSGRVRSGPVRSGEVGLGEVGLG
jgi:hypothetical protein